MTSERPDQDQAATDAALADIRAMGERWAAAELARLRSIEQRAMRIERTLTLGRTTEN